MTFSLKVAFSFLQLKIGASCKSINLCWMSIFFFSISSFTYCWCILYLHLYLMLMLFVSIPVLDVGRILGKAVCCPWDVRLHHRLDHLWRDYVPFQNIFFCYFLAFFCLFEHNQRADVCTVDLGWKVIGRKNKIKFQHILKIDLPLIGRSDKTSCKIKSNVIVSFVNIEYKYKILK